MILVIPFSRSDFKQTADLLNWIHDLGGCKSHSAILATHPEFQWSDAQQLLKSAWRSFAAVRIVLSNAPDAGWPRGANNLFLAASESISKKERQPFFYCDGGDCVPLKPGWLDALEAEYKKAGKPFLGRMYDCNDVGLPPQLLSGIAVYPADTFYLIGKNCHGHRAWDVESAEVMLKYGVDTNLIQWFWGQPNLAPTFAREKTSQSPVNTFTLGKLHPEAVVFHRNKDGTLIQLLRERMGLKSKRGRLIVRRTAALGDTLAATVVADKLIDMGFEVEFQSAPACHCILRRNPRISAISEPNGHCDVDLDNAYEPRPDRNRRHFSSIFIETANAQLSSRNIHIPNMRNATAALVVDDVEKVAPMAHLGQFPRPWVLICPRSYSHINRTVPDHIWQKAASQINGTCFWLGLDTAPAGIVDLGIRHVDNVIRYLACADMLVTTDTGPLHIAAAVRTPVVGIEQASSPTLHLSNQRDYITCAPDLLCLNCQKEICPIHATEPPCRIISPDLIAATANRRLRAYFSEDITAVVTAMNPCVNRLNKVLDHVLPQVQEVVISLDGDGIVPQGIQKSDKIRFASNKGPKRLGYAKNANMGARHSNGKYILLLNDDVFLAPDAVQKMLEVMDEKTGIVAGLLRYPDGRIQHGGTYRNPGDVSWGHIDHGALTPRIVEPCEMENVTLAAALVRRKAFYEVLGFDEEYDCYCEDNDFCMKVRRAGWKIIYNPYARGIHIEHQTTMNISNTTDIIRQSCAIFGRKWQEYFAWNKQRVPGNFDYFKL